MRNAKDLAQKLIEPRDHPLLAGKDRVTVWRWIARGQLRAWRVGRQWRTTAEEVELFWAAHNGGKVRVPRRRPAVSLATLEKRADQLLAEFPDAGPELLGKLCQHLLPEVYGRGPSRKSCNVVHGTAPARWRMAERARAMLDLDHPKDKRGMPPEHRV